MVFFSKLGMSEEEETLLESQLSSDSQMNIKEIYKVKKKKGTTLKVYLKKKNPEHKTASVLLFPSFRLQRALPTL